MKADAHNPVREPHAVSSEAGAASRLDIVA